MSIDRITLFFFSRDMTWVKSEEQKAIDAERNDQIILELLLRQSKTKLNARNLTGKTPFTAAMEAGQVAWAEKIVQAGGNLMLTKFDGDSSLDTLALKGMVKKAKWLLERWPDMVHCRNYSDRTPIHKAKEAGRDEMIELLGVPRSGPTARVTDTHPVPPTC